MDTNTLLARREINQTIMIALGRRGNWAFNLTDAITLPLKSGDRLSITVENELITVVYSRLNEATGYTDTLSIVKRNFSGSLDSALAACIALGWVEYHIQD